VLKDLSFVEAPNESTQKAWLFDKYKESIPVIHDNADLIYAKKCIVCRKEHPFGCCNTLLESDMLRCHYIEFCDYLVDKGEVIVCLENPDLTGKGEDDEDGEDDNDKCDDDDDEDYQEEDVGNEQVDDDFYYPSQPKTRKLTAKEKNLIERLNQFNLDNEETPPREIVKEFMETFPRLQFAALSRCLYPKGQRKGTTARLRGSAMRWFGELYAQQLKALEDEWTAFLPQEWVDYIRNNDGKPFKLTKQWIKDLFNFCNEMPVWDPKQETEDQFLEGWLHKMQEHLDTDTVEACNARFNACCQAKGDVYIPSHLNSVKENRRQTGKQVALMLFATGLTRAANADELSQIIAGQGKNICLLDKDAIKKLRPVRDISIKELMSGVHVALDKRTGELIRSGRAAAMADLMFAIDTNQRTCRSIKLSEMKKFGTPGRCYLGRSSHNEVSKTLDKSNMKEHTLQSKFPDQKFPEENSPTAREDGTIWNSW